MEKLAVLIAEQDPEDRDAMLEFAKRWDVLEIVDVADTPDAAIYSTVKYEPDAMILDLGLYPGGGSLSVLHQLAEIGHPHKPFILIASGNPSIVTQEEAARLGMDYYVSKWMQEDWRNFAVDCLYCFSGSLIQRRNLRAKLGGSV